MLRENFILAAVEIEHFAKRALATEEITGLLAAPYLDRKKVRYQIQEMQRVIHYWFELMGFNTHIRSPRAQGSVDAVAKLYQALEKSAFFDMIREHHFHLNPEERKRA